MRGWEARYVGMPYVDGGRNDKGVDCWGLVRLIYAEQLGIELPSYGEISAEDLLKVARRITAGKDGEEWENVTRETIQPFDVCVMRFHGVRTVGHVGIVVTKKTIIHVEKGANTALVPLTDMTIRERIACFRRHKKTKF
jgi:cell wall-associated NlpC family hydrolase